MRTLHRSDMRYVNNLYDVDADWSDGCGLNFCIPSKCQNCHFVNDYYIALWLEVCWIEKITHSEWWACSWPQLPVGQVCLVTSRSNLEAKFIIGSSKIVSVLCLDSEDVKMKTHSIYFDPVGQPPGFCFKERIEWIHEDVWEKMYICAIRNHGNIINNLSVQ